MSVVVIATIIVTIIAIIPTLEKLNIAQLYPLAFTPYTL